MSGLRPWCILREQARSHRGSTANTQSVHDKNSTVGASLLAKRPAQPAQLISSGQTPPPPQTALHSAAPRCTAQTAPAPGSQSPPAR
ncbi:hypothetical protein C1894_25520 [Pseudomonas sp. FW305-3-2-15-E-TSA2]|nr:hypothetical protein C1895_25670 [Pseudomonas sp. FW305-3-2-15-E-TSA4]POA35976.1 hypothetical protein C1894_25520 [Pseudomonas sp. FW305-3-2-15-E-TSA2]